MTRDCQIPANLPRRLREVVRDYLARQEQELFLDVRAEDFDDGELLALMETRVVPVVVRGYLRGTDLEGMTFEDMKRRAGDHVLKPADKALLSGFSDFLEALEPLKLRDYLDGEVLSANPVRPEMYQQYRNIRISPEFGQALGITRPSLLKKSEVRSPSIWIGKGGNHTVMHTDSDDNFFCVCIGLKRIHLFPPSELHLLHLSGQFNSCYLKSPINPQEPDDERFPQLKQARSAVVDVCSGDLFFLPVGWAHFVQTVENTFMYNFWLKNDAKQFYTRRPVASAT